MQNLRASNEIIIILGLFHLYAGLYQILCYFKTKNLLHWLHLGGIKKLYRQEGGQSNSMSVR